MKRNTRLIQELILLVLGNLVLVCGVQFFIIPYSILSGGVAGIAVALTPVIPVREETIILVIYLSTLVLGLIFLGKEFGVKTIISSFLFPLFVQLLAPFELPMDISRELAAVYGGVVSGLGMTMVLWTGGSTGGMDVPPLILQKYTHIKFSVLLFIVDAITVILGISTRGLEAALLGLVTVYTTSYTINKLLVAGGHHAKTIQIISSQHEAILAMVQKSLDRGATIIQAYGGYSKEYRPIVLTVITNNQYTQFKEAIHEIDPEAFLIVSDATEIKGRGFSFDYKV